jgi:indolepyruvate ferredoxin oxidoreductase, alpha subunit
MARKLVLGNAAIAEGALESGVEVVTGYPGTPSSEVIQYLSDRVIEEDLPTYVEWSVNEKVAIDVASAAAWAGKRAMVTMKMAGLNVASDTLINLAYKGVKGGLVLYVADDPGTHAGCTEQDTRYYSLLSRIPVLDSSDPQDAKALIKFAFRASQQIQIPVIVRSTTNVAHTMGVIEQEPYQKNEQEFEFKQNIPAYTTILADRESQHRAIFAKHQNFLDLMETEGLNRVLLKGKTGVIASGVSWTYLTEAVNLFDLDISTLKIDCENPWPEAKVVRMLEHCDKILVLEELDPIIENQIKQTIADCGTLVPLLGKGSGTCSRVGEYNFEIVKTALSELLNKKLLIPGETGKEPAGETIAKRNLTFCIGCPHRSTYYLLGKAVRKAGFKKKDVIITGDIGCTSIGVFKPLETLWTETTMGASTGLAHGFKIAGAEKPVIATLGDSTFFHSGIPPLINAIQHGSDITVVILDNSWTAMTGFQPNPNTGSNALKQDTTRISVVQMIEALGVDYAVIEPLKINESIQTVADMINKPGVKVVISREECTLQKVREVGKKKPYAIDPETCKNCLACVKTFGCPAITPGEKHPVIDRAVCVGCGGCAAVCQFGAIDLFSAKKEA